MHVVAIHHIHDPAGFQKAGAQALKNEPPEFKLPIRVGINDHSIGIRIWEGPVRGGDREAGRLGRRTLQQQRILRDDGAGRLKSTARA
jgi:hypothetical protein